MSSPDAFPAMSNERIQKTYNRLASTYDRWTFLERYLLGLQRKRQQLLRRVEGNVLDVACGTGPNFSHFLSANSITAVDLSTGMLDVAHQKAADLGLTIDLKVMDAGQLEFEDDSFDVVVSALSTCTFPNPVEALREMARVVKPDGRILLLEHGRSKVGVFAHLQDRFAHSHFQETGCRWNQHPLDLVRQAGLAITEHDDSVFGVFHTIEAHT